MTAVPKDEMTVDDFLVWALAQPKEAGKFELIDGRISVMQAEQFGHSRAKFRFGMALQTALDTANSGCQALVDGPTVRIGRKVAYRPDGLITCGPQVPDDSLEINAPVMVFEVLSPSSRRADTADKLQGYFQLPSLMHYVIVHAQKRFIVHHRRDATVPQHYNTAVLHVGSSLDLDPPGIAIEVATIFA